jgi:hypothetical protein
MMNHEVFGMKLLFSHVLMTRLIGVCSTLMAVACGGGGDSASAAPVEVIYKPLTLTQLATCPKENLNPAKMDRLVCLVSHTPGKMVDAKTGQLTAQPCAVDLTADGNLTFYIEGKMLGKHRVTATALPVAMAASSPVSANGEKGSFYSKDSAGQVVLLSADDQTSFYLNAIPLKADSAVKDKAYLVTFTPDVSKGNATVQSCAAAIQ